MRITDIKVFPVREKKLKAFISIVIDECFMINDIKVIKGKDGLFISMPSRRKRNGKFKDIAHPLNNETRQAMEGVILEAYGGAVAGDGERPEKATQTAPRRRDPVPSKRSEAPKPTAARTEPKTPPAEVPLAGETGSTGETDDTDKSLEEVAELHLRDSFWGT